MGHGIATRAAVIAYRVVGMSSADISKLTGVPVRTINLIWTRAIERGFNPNVRPLNLKDAHLKDAGRPGRPRKKDKAAQNEVTKETDARDEEATNGEGAGNEVEGPLHSDQYVAASLRPGGQS